MANKTKKDEETEKVSSSGNGISRIAERAKDLWTQTAAAQERAVRADMEQQRAQTQRVQEAARGLYGAYQRQTEQQARTERLRSAAEGLYSSAVRRQQEEARLRQLQDQGQRELYARAADAADRTSELDRRQLAGTDMGAQADRLMTQPIMERADRRRSSLTAGDPDKGAGKYARVMENADFRANSLPKTDVRDETYNYINDLNDARARQQGYAAQRGADSGLEKYQLMTDSERGVYNYLYNTQGKTSAEGFLARIEPELNEQYYSGQSAWMSEQANRDTASRIGFTAATVGAQPVRTLSGAAALIDAEYRTATGNEIDPYNEFQKAGALTQDIRQIITAELEEKYPKKILGINAGDLYQDVCSALDSVINSQIAGFLAEGASALRGINDVKKINTLTSRLAGAFMSGQVAATSIAEGKKKGYSNIGATTLGLIRGGIEYLTEAIGGERVASLIRTQPGTLARAVVQVMGAEAIEEMASDIGNEGVNLIADSLFGADESFLRQTHEYFEAQGSENPWADTWIAAMQQLYKSGMGGALSSFGSAAVYYGQTRATIKDTARQLNTDAKGVRSLMQEMKTDNPSAVQFLADVYEADSVEDLRAKVGQIESAEAAIDERMREIGRQAAQEGRIENETAPTERGAVDVNLEGVLDNGEQSDYRGQQNGNDDLRTGGEDLRNEAGAQRGGVDAGNEGGQSRDRFQNYAVKEEVTPADLGVINGSTDRRVQVLDESAFAEGSPETLAAQSARQAGLEPVFIRGTMDIGGKQARAYIKGNRVILQADGDVSADKLLRHEEYHREAQSNPQINRMIREALSENMSEQELTDVVSRYITAYDGVYDFSKITQEEIERICEEELFADLYAGIDNAGRQELRDAAQQGFDQAQTERGVQAEAEREIRGPTGRAAIDAHRNVVDEAVDPVKLRATLTEIYAGKNKTNYTFTVKNVTPDIYRERCHLPGVRSLVMQASKAEKAMKNLDSNGHGLGVNGLMEVFDNLDKPE